MKREKGFTLIEVLVSVLIITIVLLSFSQLIIQSNKTANINKEKLVVTNLANAYVERIQNDNELKNELIADLKLIPNNSETVDLNDIDIDKNSTTTNNQIKFIDQLLTIEIIAVQNDKEHDLNLLNIKVTITASNGITKSSVEGYIPL